MLTKEQWIDIHVQGYDGLSGPQQTLADQYIDDAYAKYVAENS